MFPRLGLRCSAGDAVVRLWTVVDVYWTVTEWVWVGIWFWGWAILLGVLQIGCHGPGWGCGRLIADGELERLDF